MVFSLSCLVYLISTSLSLGTLDTIISNHIIIDRSNEYLASYDSRKTQAKHRAFPHDH